MKIVKLAILASFVVAATVSAQSQFVAGGTPSTVTGPIHYDGGNVGVGVLNPGDKLDVGGNIHVGGDQLHTTNSLAFRDGTSNSRTVIRVMPNGNIANTPSSLEFFGTDYLGSFTNWERL